MKDKKMFYMLTIGLGLVLFVIIIIIIIANTVGGRLSFEKVEDKMKAAAIKYYNSHEEELPKTNGTTVTINAATLSNSKKMKALNNITPKGTNCTGEVIVTKNGDNYLYSPILNCGSEYHTRKLYEVVTEPKNIVISGEGLYAKENGYLFKGEKVNNLVQIDESLWAIIDVDAEGYIRMINISNKKSQRAVWDDRYNIEKDSYDGINNFKVSRIKEKLIELAGEREEEYLLDSSKMYAAVRRWCIGKRSETNLEINSNEECQELSEEMMYGLPLISDSVAASLDNACHTIEDESCDNYNYFSEYAISSWTLTGVSENTNSAYYIISSGAVTNKTSANKNIVPTIYLSKNVIYASGDGSEANPYILK